MTSVLTTLVPAVSLDRGYLVLFVGLNVNKTGEQVEVTCPADLVIKDYTIEDVDVATLKEFPQELLDQFEWYNKQVALDALNQYYDGVFGPQLGPEVPLVMLTLREPDASLYEELPEWDDQEFNEHDGKEDWQE